MNQTDIQQDALKQVAQLQAEVAEVRNRLAAGTYKVRTKFDAQVMLEKSQVMLEKSVETVAGQAGTIVGTSMSVARKFFPDGTKRIALRWKRKI